uniref:Uncharacterized protein n=1 Tax=Tetranychus urticae TaxID=32264 RepID=T1KPY0_TETUR
MYSIITLKANILVLNLNGLIYAEFILRSLAAINCLKPCDCFIIKMFNLFASQTLSLVYLFKAIHTFHDYYTQQCSVNSLTLCGVVQSD